jgi:hypothetical protein
MAVADQRAVYNALTDAYKSALARQWSRGQWARNEDGYEVEPSSLNAVTFCIEGLLYKHTGCPTNKQDATEEQRNTWTRCEGLIMVSIRKFEADSKRDPDYHADITVWNDESERTLLDVLTVLSFAMDKACPPTPSVLHRSVVLTY